MLNSQNVKFIPLAPASIASNATASLIVDRLGYNEVSFCVVQAAAAATTKPITLTVAQGDSTSSFTTISGYNGGTNATNAPQTVEAPTSATACPPIVLNVDCIGKARYLRLQMTPGTTQVLGAVAVLGRPAIWSRQPERGYRNAGNRRHARDGHDDERSRGWPWRSGRLIHRLPSGRQVRTTHTRAGAAFGLPLFHLAVSSAHDQT